MIDRKENNSTEENRGMEAISTILEKQRHHFIGL
jgi:hypothetical protein